MASIYRRTLSSATGSTRRYYLKDISKADALNHTSVLEVRNSACLRAGGAVDQGRHSKKKGSNFSEP